MNNLRLPETDSAAFRGLVTALQTFITFLIGLLLTIFQVPGVSKAAGDYILFYGPNVLFSLGIPLVIGAGLVSFFYNFLFRRGMVSTY
jgi:hypothetical protein